MEAALQIFATSDRLGVFVATAPVGGGSAPWIAYATIALALAAATGAIALLLRRRAAA